MLNKSTSNNRSFGMSGCLCKGFVIRNSKTNEVAWVDLTGTKHIYPNSKLRDNLIGCNTKVTVTLLGCAALTLVVGKPVWLFVN